MTRHRVRSIATCLLIVAAVTSACADEPPDSPVAQTLRSPTTTTTTPRLLPPRPYDVDITGLDPCKALTAAQGKQLEYDNGWERPPIPDYDYLTNTPNCGYSSSRREFGSLIALVTSENADTWLTDPGRDTGVRPKITTVSGFPALEIEVPDSAKRRKNCQIVVDVHDGQYIDIFSDQLSSDHVTDAKPYCDEARKVAAMVLENAQNR